jgi:hypothetical protein
VSTIGRGIDTAERAKADRIRTGLTAEIAHIQSRRNLTAEGKRARLARAVVKAQDQLSQLRADEAKRVAARRDELHKDLFGAVSPDDSRVISIRDAADRAARVTNANEAAELMNRAEQNGDHVLLKALARECAQRSTNPLETGWRNLFDQWAQDQPGGTNTVDELSVIHDETTDPGYRIVRELAFGIPPLPGELRGVGNLRALAAEADDEAGLLAPSSAQQAGAHLAAMVRADTA